MNNAAPDKPIDPMALVSKLKGRGPAPVHLWNPPFCGDINMRILRDGTWMHEGQTIRRKPLVKLFASILLREPDNQFYLVTPAEKVRIQVEDCPFVAVLMQTQGAGQDQQVCFTTNTDEVFVLDKEHALTVSENGETGEPHPVVHVRSGLNALIARNVFYQLVELAQQEAVDGKMLLGVWSSGMFFPLTSDPC